MKHDEAIKTIREVLNNHVPYEDESGVIKIHLHDFGKALAALDQLATEPSEDDDAVIERLSAIEHDRWSGQAKTALNDMTPERRERWTRLVALQYDQLDDHNKELDRMQVREWWPIIVARDERIRRECAERARNAIFDFGIGDKEHIYSPIIRKDLAAQLVERAIMGKEVVK